MDAESYEDSECAEKDPSGRYVRSGEILGRGAFKTVYRAFDEIDGIEVAWNEMRIDEVMCSVKDLEKLYSEVYLLQSLEHENIIKLYNSWVDEEKRTVVMITELFTSGNLRQYRKKHRNVDMKVIKKWATQILHGLVYLHSHDPPIIHRDLKCDNVFVNGNHGEVKIGDLGLATVMQQPTAHSVIGTPEFMAPELYEEEYSELVDIYAFGMCILEMVTFEYPYSECRNPAQIYRKVTSGIKPASLEKVADSQTKAFIEKCLAPAFERLSAKELLKDSFLQYEDSREPNRKPYMFPIRIPKSFDLPKSKRSMEVDSDHEQHALSPSESPLFSYLEFRRMNEHVEFRLRGKRNDDNSVSLTFCITDLQGHNKSIHFLFYLDADCGYLVAKEMVKELKLKVDDAPFIAEFIDYSIMKIIPGWVPSSGSDKSSSEWGSIITTEMPSNLVVEHELTDRTKERDSTKIFHLNLSAGVHTNSSVSTQCDHTSASVSTRSNSAISYMLLKDATNKNTKTCSHGSSSSNEYIFQCDEGSSPTTPDTPLAKVSQTHVISSLTSCHSSLSISEENMDPVLKRELEVIELEYQLMFQELARLKEESIEGARKRWAAKKNKLQDHNICPNSAINHTAIAD